MMIKNIKILLQYIIPHHALSRLIGLIAQSRLTVLKNYIICWFVRHYHVDMSEALQPDLQAYASFNDFFTRRLKADARPIAQESHAIIAPVDGVITQVGCIEQNQLLEAKARKYQLKALLADSPYTSRFSQGRFMTVYLSPRDYHRVHMPFSGQLKEMIYVPGRLFSVNAAMTVPHVFTRNERLICIFETPIGLMAVVMVGALIVAGIHTVWKGRITPNALRTKQLWQYPENTIALAKGEEMGHFELGSTVIVLFESKTVEWMCQINSEMKVLMGEQVGHSR